jgi:CRISPR-associated protein Csx10
MLHGPKQAVQEINLMLTLKLRIELLSPLCCGSGFGRTGYVDRDVVFDEAGLPYLPGRRLKGLLRDGYRQIYGPLKLTPQPKELFGEPGAATAATLIVGNATVEHAGRVRGWARRVFQDGGHTFGRDDIIECYTEIRRQTAIDRQTGAPQENTLRSTRVLREGLTFFAEVRVDDRYKESLQLAAQAVQFMGTSRTRGLGHVLCKLEAALSTLPAGAVQQPADQSELNGGPLAFSIQLEQPALFPSQAGDPNTMLTHHCVPGSTIRGLLARLYLQKYDSRADRRFYELFCSGRVCFLPANPEIATGAGLRRSLPVPHSIRVEKHYDQGFHDLVFSEPRDEPLRRVRGWTFHNELYEGGRVPRSEVTTELQYHHQRAHDPRIGKAVGAEQKDDYELKAEETGALFTYEAIAAGQRFRGEITGGAAELAEIRSLIAGKGETVYLGRSKSAQYGGRALWRWETAETEHVPEEAKAGTIVVTLESPLLAASVDGHPQPRFPAEELAADLGVRLTEQKTFARAHWQNGYLGHQLLPRQQSPALGAGSVFVFQASAPLAADKLKAARRQFGFRTEEGFGRVSLRLGKAGEAKPALNLAPVPPRAAGTSAATAGNEEYRIAMEILRRHFKAAVRGDALELANSCSAASLGRLTPHLVHRLMFLLQSNPGGLRQLSDRIARTVSNWMVQGPVSLFDFITQDLDQAYELLHKSTSPIWGRKQDWMGILADPFTEAGRQGHTENKFARDLVLYHRLRYLHGILWRKQQIAKQAKSGRLVNR